MTEQFTAYYHSPLNGLEIVGSEHGIISVSFVEHARSTTEVHPCLKACLTQLDEYFKGQRQQFDIPLDLHGTDFQIRVWSELQKIVFGKTVSYMDIALAVGTEKTIRAVGRANGQNPVAIIVPCHRVIGSDGQLVGYGGGLWRKRWLINFEQRMTQASLFDSSSQSDHAAPGCA